MATNKRLRIWFEPVGMRPVVPGILTKRYIGYKILYRDYDGSCGSQWFIANPLLNSKAFLRGWYDNVSLWEWDYSNE